MANSSSEVEIQAHEQIAEDGGYGSRKFWLAIIAMILVVGCFVLCYWMQSLAAQLTVVTGGILGAAGLYLGANVGIKYAAASVAKAPSSTKK